GVPAQRRRRRGYAHSATITEEAQQEHEDVDEVEIERKRAHYRFAADDRASSIGSYISLIRCVSQAVRPAKISTPTAEITKSRPLLFRNTLTSMAMNSPIIPMNRKEPIGERSRCVV